MQCSVYIKSLVFRLSELTIWYWYVLPPSREDHFSHSQFPRVLCIGPSPASFLLTTWVCFLLPSLFSSCLGSYVDETRRCSFQHVQNTPSHSKLPGHLALTIFLHPLLQWSLSLKWGVMLKMHQVRLGSTVLHFDQLWFSIMISNCCKK